MRETLLFSIFLISTFSLAAQQLPATGGGVNHRSGDFFIVDSLYCFSHASGSSSPTERLYNLDFTEDGEALQSRKEIYLTWLGEWRNSVLTSYVYDGQNNLTQQTEQQWDTLAGGWVNFKRILNTPNQNGDFTEVLNQNWNGSAWENVDKVNAVFNAAGFIETLTQQLWDKTAAIWKNNFRIIYASNVNGQLVQTKFQLWNAAGSSFYDVSRTGYTYNMQQLESETMTEVFNAGAAVWEKSSRSLKNYDSFGNRTEETIQLWNNVDGNWLNQTRIIQNFNAVNQVTLRTELIWNGTNWVNFFQINNVYDTDGNQTRFEVSQWQTTQWSLLTSCDFYWRFHHETVAVQELPASFCQIPNPYTIGTPVRCESLPAGEPFQLTVFDLNGKMMHVEKFDSQNFSKIAAPLPTGLYVLTISGQQGVLFSQKVMIVDR